MRPSVPPLWNRSAWIVILVERFDYCYRTYFSYLRWHLCRPYNISWKQITSVIKARDRCDVITLWTITSQPWQHVKSHVFIIILLLSVPSVVGSRFSVEEEEEEILFYRTNNRNDINTNTTATKHNYFAPSFWTQILTVTKRSLFCVKL